MTTRNLFKQAILAACLSAMPHASAYAQDSGHHLQSQSDQFGLQAGFRLTVPLGPKVSDSYKDRATLKLAISANRIQSVYGSQTQSVTSSDLFAFGFDQKMHPRLTLSGQDISYTAFPVIYADEEDGDEPSRSTNGDAMLIGGAVVVGLVGALVVINEVDDEIDDFNRCFSLFTNPCEE